MCTGEFLPAAFHASHQSRASIHATIQCNMVHGEVEKDGRGKSKGSEVLRCEGKALRSENCSSMYLTHSASKALRFQQAFEQLILD